ncbi:MULTISPECIES: hypothetical protein [unclassified Pedobacter]|uniref:hypothetical protein n=1 Tax=unclassified Pedobacter TaxID=2628915 RepID=UPI0014208417|nr:MULTISPECIES: hypothetical protein [unclassified Pedobacter]NII85377.1 hypothetical protein [Pedobacter sp. SG908]NMN39708.1 hypothetical protein [Pedobacter sp. SG918]
MEKLINNLVPQQIIGSQMDVVEERKLSSLSQAQEFFSAAAKRLLAVNEWGKISGLSDFKIFAPDGKEVMRLAQKGDFIRIDIPGPGPVSGGGFDWVKIEEIERVHGGDHEMLSMCVRPCSSPFNKGKQTAHFLKDHATSTFIIRRNRITVSAEEHGRNEQANIDDGKLIDRARNLIVGFSAKLGLSYPQWKLLVKGLLDGRS